MMLFRWTTTSLETRGSCKMPTAFCSTALIDNAKTARPARTHYKSEVWSCPSRNSFSQGNGPRRGNEHRLCELWITAGGGAGFLHQVRRARRPESSKSMQRRRVPVTPLAAAAKFCEKCGTAVSAKDAASSVHALPTMEAVRSVVAPSVPAPTQSGSKLLKVIMIAAALLVLFLVAAMGSCAYIAYRAKQRIDKVQQAYKKDDLSGMVAGPARQTATAYGFETSSPSSPQQYNGRSLKIRGPEESRRMRGDFQSIYMVNKVRDQSVHIRASSNRLHQHEHLNHTRPSANLEDEEQFCKDMNSSETDGYLYGTGEMKASGRLWVSKKLVLEQRAIGVHLP